MTDEQELPDVWIDEPLQLADLVRVFAWSEPGNHKSVHYVPAARLDALRVDRDNWEKRAFVYMDERDRERVRLDALRAELEAARADVARMREDAKLHGTLCRNLAASWLYGKWHAETYSEREQERAMRSLGWWPVTEDELVARGAAIDAARKEK